MVGFVYFALDTLLLLISIFLLLRRKRTKGEFGFTLLINSGLKRTVVEGLKVGAIVLIVPGLVERLSMRFLEVSIPLLSGHHISLLAQARSQIFTDLISELSWVNKAILFGAVDLVLLGPIAEEAFTRGFLYLAMRERWNIKVSMTLNALLFAALHFTPYGFISYFFMGLFLCYFFERTRSLLIPIIGHMVSNIPPFVVLTGMAPFPGVGWIR